MARLISWPIGVKANLREPLSGPRSVNGGSTQSTTDFNQSFSSPFGVWRWRFQFPNNIRGKAFRRYSGWLTALNGGSNATRVPFCNWDALSFEDRQLQVTRKEYRDGQPWSNGMPWSNGENWGSSGPIIPVVSGGPIDSTTIALSDQFWGHNLGIGDSIGFYPSHFGLYVITEVFDEGLYRIWPPLRKEVTAADFATLDPVMAMRLENEDAGTSTRGSFAGEGLTVTLVEIQDYYIKEYFTE